MIPPRTHLALLFIDKMVFTVILLLLIVYIYIYVCIGSYVYYIRIPPKAHVLGSPPPRPPRLGLDGDLLHLRRIFRLGAASSALRVRGARGRVSSRRSHSRKRRGLGKVVDLLNDLLKLRLLRLTEAERVEIHGPVGRNSPEPKPHDRPAPRTSAGGSGWRPPPADTWLSPRSAGGQQEVYHPKSMRTIRGHKSKERPQDL